MTVDYSFDKMRDARDFSGEISHPGNVLPVIPEIVSIRKRISTICTQIELLTLQVGELISLVGKL